MNYTAIVLLFLTPVIGIAAWLSGYRYGFNDAKDAFCLRKHYD